MPFNDQVLPPITLEGYCLSRWQSECPLPLESSLGDFSWKVLLIPNIGICYLCAFESCIDGDARESTVVLQPEEAAT